MRLVVFVGAVLLLSSIDAEAQLEGSPVGRQGRPISMVAEAAYSHQFPPQPGGQKHFASLVVGPLWQYHPDAAIGLVGRATIPFERDRSELGTSLEFRFRRVVTAEVAVDVGGGPVFHVLGTGFALEGGVLVSDQARFFVRADEAERGLGWSVGGGASGLPAVAAAGLVFLLGEVLGWGEQEVLRPE